VSATGFSRRSAGLKAGRDTCTTLGFAGLSSRPMRRLKVP